MLRRVQSACKPQPLPQPCLGRRTGQKCESGGACPGRHIVPCTNDNNDRKSECLRPLAAAEARVFFFTGHFRPLGRGRKVLREAFLPGRDPTAVRDLPRPELRRLDEPEMKKQKQRRSRSHFKVQDTDHVEPKTGVNGNLPARCWGRSPTKPWQLIQAPQCADPSSPRVMASKTPSYVRRISILLSSVMSLTHRGSNRLSLCPHRWFAAAWVINATRRRRDGKSCSPPTMSDLRVPR